MMQSRDHNLCLYDFLGKNCEMKLSNMVQLFDFSPNKPENVQCYICLKSLVRLDAYRKVLHRPRKRVGWESKKWEVWKNEFRKVEGLWSSIYQLEQNLLESLQCLEASHMKAKEILQHLPDEVFRQRVGMKINQILQNLPDFPHQHQRSLHRLSWFELKRDVEKLPAHVDGLKDMIRAWHKAVEDLCAVLRSIQDHLRVEQSSVSTG